MSITIEALTDALHDQGLDVTPDTLAIEFAQFCAD